MNCNCGTSRRCPAPSGPRQHIHEAITLSKNCSCGIATGFRTVWAMRAHNGHVTNLVQGCTCGITTLDHEGPQRAVTNLVQELHTVLHDLQTGTTKCIVTGKTSQSESTSG